MFSLFIALLSFSKFLARKQTKCLFLNDEPCMVRPSLINMNPNEFKYYPFMIRSKDALEVAMSYHQKDVFQKIQKTYIL